MVRKRRRKNDYRVTNAHGPFVTLPLRLKRG